MFLKEKNLEGGVSGTLKLLISFDNFYSPCYIFLVSPPLLDFTIIFER